MERATPQDNGQADRKLAATCPKRRSAPALLITVGFSGSGKSMLARELARRLPAVRLATDEVRKELAGVSPTSRLPAERYGPDQRRRVYEELYRRARQILARGEDVVLDGTFLSAPEREAAAALAREVGAEFWLLECRCPDEVIRQRLEARSRKGADPSDAGVAVYEAQLRSWEALDPAVDLAPPHVRRVVVDTDQPPNEAVGRVLDAFGGEDAR